MLALDTRLLAYIEESSKHKGRYSMCFWLLRSEDRGTSLTQSLGLNRSLLQPEPGAQACTYLLDDEKPVFAGLYSVAEHPHFHLLAVESSPWATRQKVHKTVARSKGRVRLFPIGMQIIRNCVRIDPKMGFDKTEVLRAVSYPVAGAVAKGTAVEYEPGPANIVFQNLEEGKKILRTVRMRIPSEKSGMCEVSLGRDGFACFHKGSTSLFYRLMTEKLLPSAEELLKPFQKPKERFWSLKFTLPLGTAQGNYRVLLDALSKIPRSSVAVVHRNPYFHATLVSYEDNSKFDVYVTDTTTLTVERDHRVSEESLLRLKSALSECLSEAQVRVPRKRVFSVEDVLQGRV